MKKKIIGPVLTLLLFACFGSANAQQSAKPTPQVGFISSTGTPENPSPLFEAFRQGLRELGYVDG